MPVERFTIGGSLGPLFIGVVLTSCLYGVTSFQTYIYFTRGSGADNRFVKYLVLFLWVLSTLRLAIISYAAYTYLVTDFMDAVAILKPTWAMFPATLITVGTNNAVVRGVFCYRIWRLSGKKIWLAMAISLTILMSFGTTFAYSVLASRLPTWFNLDEYRVRIHGASRKKASHSFPVWQWLLAFCFAVSVAADTLICASLCVLLAIRKTGYARSDTIVRKLMLYAVNNGLLSTLCTVLCLTTYLTMPHNFVFVALYIIYPELILSALLATFNRRRSLQLTLASVSTVQHAALDSAQTQIRGGHATQNINIIELGAVSPTTPHRGDMRLARVHGDEADKIPEFNA